MTRLVLVVEGDPTIREILELALTDEGYTVAVAPNAATAGALLQRTRPDLLLVDLALPVPNGASACEAYRAGPPPHAPLILMSTDPEQLAAQADAQGVVGCLPKPFELEHLLALVQTHLGP